MVNMYSQKSTIQLGVDWSVSAQLSNFLDLTDGQEYINTENLKAISRSPQEINIQGSFKRNN